MEIDRSEAPRTTPHVVRRPTATIPPVTRPARLETAVPDPSAVETSRFISVPDEPGARHLSIAGAAVVVALVVGFVFGRSTASRAPEQPPAIKVVADEPEAQPATPTAPAPVALAEAEPEPATVNDPEREPEAAPAAASLAAATTCAVAVRSMPSGASVSSGGVVLGRTPLQTSLPCGRADLTLRRARYLDETRRVLLQPGAPHPIDARLERPEYQLHVISRPHALVHVNGVPIGFSPITTRVKAFTPVELSFERSGYQSGATTVQATLPTTDIDVTLLPER
jgi:hypothetical protein